MIDTSVQGMAGLLALLGLPAYRCVNHVSEQV
jgi:hypothetical protein